MLCAHADHTCTEIARDADNEHNFIFLLQGYEDMYSRVKRPRRPVQGMIYSSQKNKTHQTKLTGECQFYKTKFYVIYVHGYMVTFYF